MPGRKTPKSPSGARRGNSTSPRRTRRVPTRKPSDFSDHDNFEDVTVQAAHLYAVSKELLQQQADAEARESRMRHPERQDHVVHVGKQNKAKTVAGRYDTARNNLLVAVTTPSVLEFDEAERSSSTEAETRDSPLAALGKIPHINTAGLQDISPQPSGRETVLGLLGSPRTRSRYSSNETVWIRKFELSPRKAFLPVPQQQQRPRPSTTQPAPRRNRGSNAFKAVQRVVNTRRPRTVRVNSESKLAEYREHYEYTLETERTALRSSRDRDALAAPSCSDLRTQALLDRWHRLEVKSRGGDVRTDELETTGSASSLTSTSTSVRDTNNPLEQQGGLPAKPTRRTLMNTQGNACREYREHCTRLGVVPGARVLESLASCDDEQRESEQGADSAQCRTARIHRKSKGHTVKLLLAHQSLGDKSIDAMCLTLQSIYDVLRAVQLDLGGNSVSKTGAALIGKLVSTLPVTTLSLQEQPRRTFGTAACSIFLSCALPAERHQVVMLEHLDLSGNNLGDGIAKKLFTLVTRAPLLQRLVLARNRLGTGTCEALTTALSPEWRDPQDPLSSLVLGWNNLGTAGGLAIAGCLQAGMCVARLDLSFAGLGDEVAVAVANALRQNSCMLLTELNLSRNRIGAVGGSALAECLAANKHLKTLYIGFNPLSSAVSFAFLALLTTNTTLNKLGLENCHLGVEYRAAGAAGGDGRTTSGSSSADAMDNTPRSQPLTTRSTASRKTEVESAGGKGEESKPLLSAEELARLEVFSYKGSGDVGQELHDLLMRVNSARRRALVLTKQANLLSTPRIADPTVTAVGAETFAGGNAWQQQQPSRGKQPRFNVDSMTLLAGPPVHVALEYPPKFRPSNAGAGSNTEVTVLSLDGYDDTDLPVEQRTRGADSVFAPRAFECDSEALYDTMSVVQLAFLHDWQLLHARLVSALALRRQHIFVDTPSDTDAMEEQVDEHAVLEQAINQVKLVLREHYVALSDIATYYSTRPLDHDTRHMSPQAFMQLMKECRVLEGAGARLGAVDLRLIFVSANVPGQDNDRILEALRAERERERDRRRQAAADAEAEAEAEEAQVEMDDPDIAPDSAPTTDDDPTEETHDQGSSSADGHATTTTTTTTTAPVLGAVDRQESNEEKQAGAATATTTTTPQSPRAENATPIANATEESKTTSVPAISGLARASQADVMAHQPSPRVDFGQNPRNKLIRHEFLLALVLIAKRKYCQLPSGSTINERAENLLGVSSALSQLLQGHILRHAVSHNANRWRRDHLYWFDVHHALSTHEPLLRDIWADLTSNSSNGLITAKAWIDFMQRAGLLSSAFTMLDAMRVFTFSNMMVKRDHGRDRSAHARDTINELSWCEFLEALVRVAQHKSQQELGLEHEYAVSVRVCHLLLVIFKALRLSDMRSLWRSYWRTVTDGEGKIAPKDWTFLEENLHHPLIITPSKGRFAL